MWAAVPATRTKLSGRLGCQASGSCRLAAQAAAWMAGVSFKQPNCLRISVAVLRVARVGTQTRCKYSIEFNASVYLTVR